MSAGKRILITRTDRLGDVLMSLHTVRMLRLALPDHEINLLSRADLAPLLEGLLTEWKVGFSPWETLDHSTLGAYSAALCLFDEPQLLTLLKKAGIKVRTGNYSKLRSFMKLTHGIRQRRGQGSMNEGEYNLALGKLLLGVLGADSKYQSEPIRLPVNEHAKAEANAALERAGISGGETYWMAHPGMGGSALNLDAKGYVALLDAQAKHHKGPLILTLGPSPKDLHLVEAIADERHEWRVLPKVSLSALAEVFRGAELVVAPSTGPLHLAHYVGTQTLGVFSPVRSHQPKRWAPWGGAGLSKVLVPEEPCPGTKNCLGARCRFYFCMDKLPLRSV